MMKIALLDASSARCAAYAAGVEDVLYDHKDRITTALGIDQGCLDLYFFCFGEKGRRYEDLADQKITNRDPLPVLFDQYRETELPDLSKGKTAIRLGFGVYEMDEDVFRVIPAEQIVKDPENTLRAVLAGAENGPYLYNGSSCLSASFREPLPVEKIADAHDLSIVIAERPEIKHAIEERDLGSSIAHRYPLLGFRLKARDGIYRRSFRKAEKLEKQGRVILCVPARKDPEGMYDEGCKKGYEILERISGE